MGKQLQYLAKLIVIVVAFVGCDQAVVGEDACRAETHCYYEDEIPTCDEGYEILAGVCVTITGCEAESAASFCSRVGYECGEHTEKDLCGALREFSCGGCQSGTCSASGTCASATTCAGECSANTYTSCTCGSTDPCGWSNNNSCDSACKSVVPSPFDDSGDCMSAAGSCAQSVNLNAAGGSYQANTANYGDDFELFFSTQCNSDPGSGDVVFSYTPSQNGMLVASTVFPETTTDTVVGLLNVCSPDAAVKSCNNDISGIDPRTRTRWHAVAGQPLWIVVDAWPEGQFKLEVSIEDYAGEGESCSDVEFNGNPTLPICEASLNCVNHVCIDLTCPSKNDGVCDEPEGSGLCPEGADPLDCAFGSMDAESKSQSSRMCVSEYEMALAG